MTPTENPEAAGSNGTPASPPWQRVDKEGDAEATVKLATEDAPTVAAERPVVTGTAAPRLFGGSGDTPPAGAEVPPASAQRARPSALRRPGRGPRRASLQVKRFDPWSVLKLSLVLGVAMFFVWLVAVGVLYTVLDGMGVWDKLNGTYSSLVGGEGANASAEPLISAGRVFGIAAILGAINIVLVSALATVSAFIYNVSADLAGGLEVTLSERE
ncbi:DUF3566 domain-containing protein [Amycolatopsis sp. Hca4]|uniref:DUF3566 domain-containing protein n=1 Tax=unclassified Amycolatopsis TaxID=2618356 RepID=UPI001591D531|nr:DUF3566 domain-containing protein [Amycolatopsis sp. Hca4]QKV77092.1 DUF3566 domain-containing protein [Amycolatopsis sp. Hca4]